MFLKEWDKGQETADRVGVVEQVDKECQEESEAKQMAAMAMIQRLEKEARENGSALGVPAIASC